MPAAHSGGIVEAGSYVLAARPRGWGGGAGWPGGRTATGRRLAKSLLASSARTSAPVACLLDQVRVRVEGHARARVTKDVADLDDVEVDVDDQVAREGVAQVVEAHAPSLDIEPGVDGGASEHPLGDVVVQERRAVRGREHVVRFGSEA